MKKLCRSQGTVHPSPPTITDHLAFLPAYLLALAASLSPADLEVLAYLITANNADEGGATPVPSLKKGCRKYLSSAAKQGGKGRAAGSCSVFGGGGGGGKGGDDGNHDPNFCCDCFRCYMSYWVRWDKSPDRLLIDEIIDAYEAGLARGSGGNNGRGSRGRKDRRKARGSEAAAAGGAVAESPDKSGGGEQKDTEIEDSDGDVDGDEVIGSIGGDEVDKGSVRKLVSFIGERIWGVWN